MPCGWRAKNASSKNCRPPMARGSADVLGDLGRFLGLPNLWVQPNARFPRLIDRLMQRGVVDRSIGHDQHDGAVLLKGLDGLRARSELIGFLLQLEDFVLLL